MTDLLTPSQAPASGPLHQAIRDILLVARKQVRQTVNETMVQAYWYVGQLIVEDEQGGAVRFGSVRAGYGKHVLPELAKRLSVEFGKGFSAQSLWNHRQFYLEFPNLSAAWRDLHWSHFKTLMCVKEQNARTWCANGQSRLERSGARPTNWNSVESQISTAFRRIRSSDGVANGKMK